MSLCRNTLSLILILLAGAASAATVTFDAWPLGRLYGSGTHMAGDLITMEQGVSCFAESYDSGSGPAFGTGQVYAANPNFGSGRSLGLNTIGMRFLFPQTSQETSIPFANFGGAMNLKVNNGQLWIFNDPLVMDEKTVAPGVTAYVTATDFGNVVVGVLTLDGPVQSVSVAGEELLLDDLEGRGVPAPDYAGDSGEACDIAVTYETQVLGTLWTNEGALLFTEAGIPVYAAAIQDGAGEVFESSQVVQTHDGVGTGNEARLTKSAHVFSPHDAGLTATRVSWVFHDYDGVVDLQVNRDVRYQGPALLLPANPAPGVSLSVATEFTPDGVKGRVTLNGPVEEVRIGGLRMDLDNVCFEFADGPILGTCDVSMDMQHLAPSTFWFPPDDQPGDVAFVKDGVEVRLAAYHHAGTDEFLTVSANNGLAGFDDGRVLYTQQSGVEFDLTALGGAAQFSVEYYASGGFENLQVNGATLWDLEMADMPAAVAPGVTLVNITEVQPSGSVKGKLVLTGDVQTVRLGGFALFLDNVCVLVHALHTDVADGAAPALLAGVGAFPNPFNPSTTVGFRLEAAARATVTIHDAAGRAVRNLADADLPAGEHALRWDGRDRIGATAAAGVYFARVTAGREVRVVKLALIK
ncbi:MAG TPA: FlgD immunoglobulin-like domain containing protein [Candidatus Krumholzibacteria bacterium]|mgnify:CR=1 FL=1|nr:FlgD immunoglobulin-like domain containing protein [Candidatus Krumholzibacteria bacterium]